VMIVQAASRSAARVHTSLRVGGAGSNPAAGQPVPEFPVQEPEKRSRVHGWRIVMEFPAQEPAGRGSGTVGG